LNRDELIRRLTATFLEELAEHVRVFNAELLLLEQNPALARREEAIHSLFRAAHSLKGAARAVSATGIESVAHRLEDLLARIRDGRRQLTPDLFRVLFAAADGFESAGRRFSAGSATDAGLGPLVEQLNAALLLADSPPPAPAAAPEPAPEAKLVSIGDAPKHAEISGEGPISQLAFAADTNPEPSAPPAASAASHAQGSFVRIGHARLDTLLRQSSELTITRRRFEARREELSATQETLGRLRAEWQASGPALRRFKQQAPRESGARVAAEFPKRLERLFDRTEEELSRFSRDVERISAALREDTKALDRAASPLEAQIHQLRLLPFSQACEGLGRVVRDLSLAQQKQVDLKIVGAEMELDRAIVEGLREPLLHLLRNAIDHGIEPAEARARAQKPARATLTIAAIAAGDSVEVSVSDDGRGLDREAIRVKLRERGFRDESASSDLERAIFLPGFSTARKVTDVSGRGVGLDIVKTTVERMNGSVAVTADDSGTRFALTLPLTLSTVRVLFVRVGSEVLALPSAAVEVLLRVAPSELKFVAEKAVIAHGGVPVTAATLAPMLGLPQSERIQDAPLFAVVLRAQGRRAALIVDEFLTEQDVLLKSLGPRVQELLYVSSGTLLSSGEVALVLKPQALLRAALDVSTFNSLAAERAQVSARHRLLLADDSLTTRALERSILEAAGYDVIVAVDGQSAWQLLQERGADLLLSDVEMPRMDGLALTKTVRNSARFRDLPVILLTSRDSPEDRARGLEAGANAYLVKSAFDQTKLLRAIEQLL
jgi:two-component system, chemotaxis family, sensor kinase CheA